jgi:hypothetical protein
MGFVRLVLLYAKGCNTHSPPSSGTYPNGFMPTKQAVFHNTRSYKNMLAGAFVHNSGNIMLRGGVFADNSIQIDLDRADSIEVVDSIVIGMSPKFKQILSVEQGFFGRFDAIIGIQIHSFRLDETDFGSAIRGVRFLAFDDTIAAYSALIDVDDEKLYGVFDYWYVD